MMKQLIRMWVALALLGWAGLAQATLIDLGSWITYDDVHDLYWYGNLADTYDTNTYDGAVDFYEKIEVTVWNEGRPVTLDDFHIASTDEYLSLRTNDNDNIYQTFNTGITEGEPYDRWFVGRYGEGFLYGNEPYHWMGGPIYQVRPDGSSYWIDFTDRS